MGIGATLVLIAIGAILAFATHFTVSGIDVQMVGWILIAVGVISLLITFAYVRPRRRVGMVEVDPEGPVYDDLPDQRPVDIVTERSRRRYLTRPLRSRTRQMPHVVPDDDPNQY